MSMSVCKFDSEMKGYTVLYDCIPTIEDAELLAQLAMIEKRNDELIFSLAGIEGLMKNQNYITKLLYWLMNISLTIKGVIFLLIKIMLI